MESPTTTTPHEHQSVTHKDMCLRVLGYAVRAWELYRKQHAGPLPMIIPVVISHDPRGWTAPTCFHAMFDPALSTVPELAKFLPSFEIRVEDLMRTPEGQRGFEQVLNYVLLVAGKVLRERLPETEQVTMTMAEQLLARGQAKGHALALIKLMGLKFGPLSPEHADRIAAATEEQLDIYLEHILTALTPDAVFGD